MSTPFDLRLRRAFSILTVPCALLGCHVTVHNHGSTPAKSAGGGSDKVTNQTPKDEKTKGDKADKPKGDKADKPKGDKPKTDKPKDEKPKGDQPKTDKPAVEKPDKPNEPKPPVVTPQEPGKPSEPPPPPGVSRLIVPVRAPFEKIVQQVDSLLPKTQSQDYTRVTKDGDNVVLDVKYKMWRDPIEAKFKGRTLTVVVPVRYAANIRGKVKNPLGGDYFPLSDGQTWGTSSSPQRMRITLSVELDVNDEWRLDSQSKLESIEHGPVPKGNFCAKVGIDICTPKENLAGEVRKNIERYLTPKLTKELERADKEIEKNLDLRAHARSLWTSLQKPLPLQNAGQKSCPTAPVSSCTEPAWLVLEPTSLGLSELSLVDGDLGVNVGLEGKLKIKTGNKPKVKVEPLPKPAKPEGSTSFQLSTDLEVPLRAFDKEIAEALQGKAFKLGKDDLLIRDVKLSVQNGKELALSVRTKGAYEAKLGASGKLVLDEKKGELRIEQLTFDEATKKLLGQELKGLDEKDLGRELEKASRIALGKESKTLRRAIKEALGGALPGQLEVKGTLGDVSFVDLDVKQDVLRVRVELTGSLGLEYNL